MCTPGVSVLHTMGEQRKDRGNGMLYLGIACLRKAALS
jgi:hypothetical protein